MHLNPLDLPLSRPDQDGARTAPADALTRRALFLHTLLAVLTDTSQPTTCRERSRPRLGQRWRSGGAGLSALERSVLDTAITATYTAAGITDDPTTWALPAPLLADLRATLRGIANPDPAPRPRTPATLRPDRLCRG